jgi:hypothetical protein
MKKDLEKTTRIISLEEFSDEVLDLANDRQWRKEYGIDKNRKDYAEPKIKEIAEKIYELHQEHKDILNFKYKDLEL